MSSPIALVTGATGRQGGATALELLKNSNAKVHVLVRDSGSDKALKLKELGATLLVGDFDDVISLSAAIKGMTTIFLNVSPSSEKGAEVRHANNLIEVAKGTDTVTHIIYPSIVETGRHEMFPGWNTWDPDSFMVQYWLSKHQIESLVRESGIQHWTILRPTTFMSNYHNPSLPWFFPELPKKHTFRTALAPTTRTMLISPDDIGKFAAAAIMDPEAYTHREIDIGAEALTPGEITQTLSKVSGQAIRAERIPLEEATKMGKTNMGIAAQLFFNERSSKMDLEALEQYHIRLTTFEEYLASRQDVVKASFS